MNLLPEMPRSVLVTQYDAYDKQNILLWVFLSITSTNDLHICLGLLPRLQKALQKNAVNE